MKLLTEGDDFGFTRGVTYGIVDAIDHGILRNTGLFTNMPSTELAVSFMKDRPQVCFGIDYNIVSGPCVSDPVTIPHLVDENGCFIRSGVRVNDPRYATEEGRREMFPYTEVYTELKAQYERFIALTGRKPGYMNPHSIMPETYIQAIRDLARENGVLFSMDIVEKLHMAGEEMPSQKKTFDPAVQLAYDPFAGLRRSEKKFLDSEYVWLCRHPGYVDAELMGLTSLSLERMQDAAMYMSQEMKDWVEKNHIELITYYDLYEVEK